MMTMRAAFRTIAMACALLGAGLVLDGSLASWLPASLTLNDAHARVGRPATPVSVAGVARRTTRRVIRRSTVFVATLPPACTQVNIEGTVLMSCGGTYYQASGTQYVVVYVD
jgi:hypothetical protein